MAEEGEPARELPEGAAKPDGDAAGARLGEKGAGGPCRQPLPAGSGLAGGPSRRLRMRAERDSEEPGARG